MLAAVLLFETGVVGVPQSVFAQVDWLRGHGDLGDWAIRALALVLAFGLAALLAGPERIKAWSDHLRKEDPPPAPQPQVRLKKPVPRPSRQTDLSQLATSLALPKTPPDPRQAAIRSYVEREGRVARARATAAKQLEGLYIEGEQLRSQWVLLFEAKEHVLGQRTPQAQRESAARSWGDRIRWVLDRHDDPELVAKWEAVPPLPPAHPTLAGIRPMTSLDDLRAFLSDGMTCLAQIIGALNTPRGTGYGKEGES